MNPMIRKELRQRMRERRAWLLPSLYLLVLGATVAVTYYFKTSNPWSFGQWSEPQGAEVGTSVFTTVAYTQMALLLLLAPVFSAGALTIEKEQRTLAGLLTSLLTPTKIWWGKFVASLLFLTLLFVSALPVLSLAFALGGVGPRELIAASGITLTVLGSMCAIGLYCSSYFRRSVHATAVTYAAVIALTVVTLVLFIMMESHWVAQAGPNARQEQPDYIAAPLFLNPFFALFAVLQPAASSWGAYPPWLISLQLFVALGCLATAFALRNLRRGGEQF